VFELIHPQDRETLADLFFDATTHSGTNPPTTFRVQTASGDWRYLEAISTNCLADPAIRGIVVNAHDVTEHMNLTRALKTLTQGNQTLVHATDETSLLEEMCRTIIVSGRYLLAWVGYLDHDEHHTVHPVASAGNTEYLNGISVSWSSDDLGQGPVGKAIRTQSVQVLNDMRRSKSFTPWRAAAEEFGFRTCCALPLALGENTIGALAIYAGEPGAFEPGEVALLRELVDDLGYGIWRLRDAKLLHASEERFRTLAGAAPTGILEAKAGGGIVYANPWMAEITGRGTEAMMGASWIDVIHPDDASELAALINRSRSTGAELETSFRIQRPDGEIRHVRMLAAPKVRNADSGYVVLIDDITEQIAAERELEHSREFLSAITDNMAEGMIATDGDGVVTFANAAAERILGWGSGELLGKSGHATYHFRRVDGSPYPLEECPLANVFAHGEHLQVDQDIFIRRDGTAVPVAYSASPVQSNYLHGAVIVFDDISERMTERLRVAGELEKLSWVERIRDALDEDRFVLYAQPIVDLTTNATVQHELLLRMVSPDGEVVLPQFFLPVAEEFGLISEIDRWVVGETARLTAKGFALEFNLSAKSVMDPDMLIYVRTSFQEHGASLESVVCEITETALLSDIAAVEVFVRGLNEMGCKVALDDFGAGYGGFGNLKLPVSYLKIDVEFVRDLPREASSRHVVSAVVNLAKGFSLQTIAEGAEDEATLEILKELGVDCVQGYVIARPRPVAEVLVAPTWSVTITGSAS
jgi:PAS domain S-box-containing protein